MCNFTSLEPKGDNCVLANSDELFQMLQETYINYIFILSNNSRTSNRSRFYTKETWSEM